MVLVVFVMVVSGCGAAKTSTTTSATVALIPTVQATVAPSATTAPTVAPSATTAPTAVPPATPELDPSLPSNFGSVALDLGFPDDPDLTDVTSGGDIDASYLPGACVGFATAEPDLKLDYGGGGDYLRIFFEPDTAGDTALVVSDPDGNWHCNDDFDGLNPAVEFTDPLGGVYDIWVASFVSGDFVDGVIGLTEFEFGAGGGDLDPSLDANFGTVELEPGFPIDPDESEVVSGGETDVAYLAAGCVGFATAAPDLELDYGAGGEYLRIFFEPDTAGDIALIVNDPNGGWHCNDDFDGLNPGIEFFDPDGGIYDIWVASFDSGDFVDGIIGLTEFEGLNHSLESNFGTIDLDPGFPDDPDLTDVTSGGDIDASYLPGACVGFATAEPDLKLDYGGGGDYLRIFFEPDTAGDTALVVSDPDGNWHCNDDFDGLNPAVEFTDPLGGVYDIWVASFVSGDFVDGIVGISEFP